ncbi:PD-(D/E)XK nuclease family protein [Gorillibacterium timonense]|uniref:PD-(D/E)XK nuclease family protein n=1 Tax=Gorillibacterium timonense TaxID=1689269 RepID=UPI00071DA5A2|nr:PD-(D/E)XK nuclease family protein [Gorillibacterium timonense]
MPLQVVIGRAGSGKTAHCLGEIGERLRSDPEGGPLLLLVPEQATFQAEQALLALPGVAGYMRAQVFSFRRLAWRAMQELGGTAGVPVSDLGKTMLLERLLHQHEQELRVFRQPPGKLGVAQSLNGLFKDLQRNLIASEQLSAAARRLMDDPEGPSLDERQEAEPISELAPSGSDRLTEKLGELSLLYGDYRRTLSGRFLDSETFLDRLAEGASQISWLKEAEIWVDGFYGFTPQERRVLVRLALHSRKMTIALPLDRPYQAGDEPDEFGLFYSPAKAMAQLLQKADEAGVEIADPLVLPSDAMPRFRRSPMLAHLERTFEDRAAARRIVYPESRFGSDIVMAAAVNRRAEVEGCAREIVRLSRDEGRRYREMAIRVRRMDEYADLIQQVFTSFGIPHFLDERRPVLHHPLMEFIRSAQEVVIRDWPYEAVFRCVKTDFLLGNGTGPLEGGVSTIKGEKEGREAGEGQLSFFEEEEAAAALDPSALPHLDRRGVDLLENYVLARGIAGSRWKDDRYWELYVPLPLDEEEEAVPREATEAEKARHGLIKGNRDHILLRFAEFERLTKKAKTVREHASALYTLLTSCGVPEKLQSWSDEALRAGEPEKAQEHVQLWDKVIELFDELVELMGDEELDAELFARLVDTGLESLCLGLVPPALDQVLVGSMDRTRSEQKWIVFILGANEGVLPAKPEEDGIWSDAERLRLTDAGLELPGGARRRLLDEQLLLYTGLTSPSDRLWLSYTLADDEGKALLPSEIIRQLGAVFPLARENERLLYAAPPAAASNEETLSYLTHPDRALSDLGVYLQEGLEGQQVPEVWQDVYRWLDGSHRSDLALIQSSLTYGIGQERLDSLTAKELYGDVLRASVSRMERFVACPFSHFASHGLRLKERRLFRLEAPDIGQLFHAALSQVVRELNADGLNWSDLPMERVKEKASQAVDRIIPRLQGEILLSNNRYRYIARKLKEIVTRASAVVAEHARGNGFYPVELELAFGPGEKLPPLVFPLNSGGRMEIAGRIDRVDRADGEKGMYLRVIDYKSSARSLDLTELYSGLSLQMLTYLDVVVSHSERWLGQKAIPAGVLYFHVHNPLLSMPGRLDPETAEAELRRRFKMKGLLLADKESLGLMDAALQADSGASDILPVAIKKDGTFRKGASVASEDQWSLLQKHVRGSVKQIGSQIAAGVANVEPYKLGRKTACDYCPYLAVCQMDTGVPGGEFRTLPAYGSDAVWSALERSAGKPEQADKEAKS